MCGQRPLELTRTVRSTLLPSSNDTEAFGYVMVTTCAVAARELKIRIWSDVWAETVTERKKRCTSESDQ